MASNISQPFSQDGSADINVGNINGTVSLPTGAATAANQATEIASLASIDAGIPATLGATGTVNSMPVVDILTGIGAQYRAQSVTTTAALALGSTSALANRRAMVITPTNGTIYWGTDSSVTTANGQPVLPLNTIFLNIGPSVTVYLISATTTDVRITEMS